MKLACSQILLVLVLLVPINGQASAPKRVVGATEVVFIEEANLSIKARVDTGANTSSIHAEKIEIASFGDPKGKPNSFIW